MDIGFIGLGEMGAVMVANILRAGHTVRVWNRSPERAQTLSAAGAQVVATPAEAFTGDAVFSMLADDAALRDVIDSHFGLADMPTILKSLQREARCEYSGWAQETEDLLRAKRSPLMVCVTLEQVRRARHMSLADDLREEWLMMRSVFNLDGRSGAEGVEGIRAMVVDKDHKPRWQHERIEDVKPADIARFFDGERQGADHPLRDLGQ